MKNKPLFVQVWAVLVLTLAIFFVVGGFIVSRVSYEFFANQAYEFLERSQDYVIKANADKIITPETSKQLSELDGSIGFFGEYAINHLILDRQGNMILATAPIHSEFYRDAYANARIQGKERAGYKLQIGRTEYYYVARTIYLEDKMNIFGRESNYFISYVGSNYRRVFLQMMLRNLIFILVISLLPAAVLARYMVQPLLKVEKSVRKIAKKEWHEPLEIDRHDEIGRLLESVEWMREELYREDVAQKEFFHNISHNLKTPVMVIRSYIEALKEGILPADEVLQTLDLIANETEEVEALIKNLLLLAKLDYFGGESLKEQLRLSLKESIIEIYDRMRYHRLDIDWELDLETGMIVGDREHIRVCLENIMENQLKYAAMAIKIRIREEAGAVLLSFWNDGKGLEPELLEELFDEFKVGRDGNIGLGLSIVKKIVDLHGGTVEAANEDGGVVFRLRFPDGNQQGWIR